MPKPAQSPKDTENLGMAVRAGAVMLAERGEQGSEPLNLYGSILRKSCLLAVMRPSLQQVIQKAQLIGSAALLSFALSNPMQAMGTGELVIVRINSASGTKERIGMIMGTTKNYRLRSRLGNPG